MILFIKDENRGVFEAKQTELPQPNGVRERKIGIKKWAMCEEADSLQDAILLDHANISSILIG